jgi:glycosyltransferase involved in cell wall biosynthesis/SAM-dependent methyltransferase
MQNLPGDMSIAFGQHMIVCAACLQALTPLHDERIGTCLFCAHCGGIYPVHHTVPQLIDLRSLLRLPEDRLAVWHLTQQRAATLYQTQDPASCSLGTREDVQAFRRFMHLRDATVLDIGSGSFTLPGYIEATGCKEFIGIDPIPTSSTPDFPLLVGLGEMLAFRNETFDVVIVATSLDHVLDVDGTLAETCRVLKPGGRVYFWGGFSSDASALDRSLPYVLFPRMSEYKPLDLEEAVSAYLQHRAAYEAALQHIEANTGLYETLLVDHYHFRHFTEEALIDAFAKADLWCSEEATITTTQGVVSRCMCFVKKPTAYLSYRHFVTLQQDFRALRQQTDALQQITQDTQQQAHTIEQQVHAIEQQGHAIEQQVHAIEQQGHAIEQQGHAIEQQAPEIKRQVYDTFQVLQQQMNTLQHIMQDAQQQVHTVQQQVQANQCQIHNTQQQVQVTASQLQEVQQQVLKVGRQVSDTHLVVQATLDRLQARKPAIKVSHYIALMLSMLFTPLRLCKRLLRQGRVVSRRVRKVLFVVTTCASAFFSPQKSQTTHGKRVLMLTISHIDIDPRINKVARTLVSEGYEVDILCYQNQENAAQIVEEVVLPGIRYVRVPRESQWQGRNNRVSLWYQEELRRAGTQRVYDYVHANDLTTLLVGWILARTRGVPLIYDAHEMWSENVIFDNREWVPMPPRVRTIARYYEGFLVKYVDLLISVSPSICQEFQRRYKLRQPPSLLANYTELALARNGPCTLPSIRDLCDLSPEHFITLYLGGVNPLRNIESVIQAHQYLPDKCVFVIRGPGVEYYQAQYQDLAKSLGVEQRIFYLPPVAMDEVILGAAGANCGIVMLRNICKNFYWFYPNKFFEYMLAGLPVAVSHFPDVTAHVEREKCGVIFDPESPQSIAEAIRWLYEHPQEAQAMGSRGREGVLREYNWEAASEGLLQAYQKLPV